MRKRWAVITMLYSEEMPVHEWDKFYTRWGAKRELTRSLEAAHEASISPLALAYYLRGL